METEKRSFDWLHEELQKGFEALKARIPNGQDPVLQVPRPMADYSALGQDKTTIFILDCFATVVNALGSCYSPERILEIMSKEGGTQSTLMDDTDALFQKYLD